MVGAGLGDRVHDCAADFAVLRIEAVGDQAKLGNGIKIGNEAGAHVFRFVDVAAIHQEHVAALRLTVDRQVARVANLARDGAIARDGA